MECWKQDICDKPANLDPPNRRSKRQPTFTASGSLKGLRIAEPGSFGRQSSHSQANYFSNSVADLAHSLTNSPQSHLLRASGWRWVLRKGKKERGREHGVTVELFFTRELRISLGIGISRMSSLFLLKIQSATMHFISWKSDYGNKRGVVVPQLKKK